MTSILPGLGLFGCDDGDSFTLDSPVDNDPVGSTATWSMDSDTDAGTVETVETDADDDGSPEGQACDHNDRSVATPRSTGALQPGPRPVRASTAWGSDIDASVGQSTICQGQPDVFAMGACAYPVQVRIRPWGLVRSRILGAWGLGLRVDPRPLAPPCPRRVSSRFHRRPL